MSKLIKKIVCIASTISLCSIYAIPIYAISEKDTSYCKMNNIGEVYKNTSNQEEKNEERKSQGQMILVQISARFSKKS